MDKRTNGNARADGGTPLVSHDLRPACRGPVPCKMASTRAPYASASERVGSMLEQGFKNPLGTVPLGVTRVRGGGPFPRRP